MNVGISTLYYLTEIIHTFPLELVVYQSCKMDSANVTLILGKINVSYEISFAQLLTYNHGTNKDWKRIFHLCLDMSRLTLLWRNKCPPFISKMTNLYPYYLIWFFENPVNMPILSWLQVFPLGFPHTASSSLILYILGSVFWREI